jgi:UDP-N-acetylmuramate dehydrogenase
VEVAENVPLAERCTLGVGGCARFFAEARDEDEVIAAHEWASRRHLDLRVLGGGSNLVVADEGVDALVVKLSLRGVSTREVDGGLEVTAAAGEPWDDLVGHTVARGWAGLECLSGIPGLVGATPIQNVGAYGQEVSDTVTSVRALDRRRGAVVVLSNHECGFAYRDSAFKHGDAGRHVVTAVAYRLRPGGQPTVTYADLQNRLRARGLDTSALADVRQVVLDIRRAKSMVLGDPGDPNRRTCGSFFLNPILSAAAFLEVEARAADPAMPRWPEADGRVKLSAAWLIEHAGFERGARDGVVGLSTRHALAIVCHAGARARDVVRFAQRVQAAVEARFGVRLVPEPAFWGLPGLDHRRPAT